MRPARILIVDDEPAVVKGLRMRLGIAGYDCRTADGGDEALRAATSEDGRPDLILLDMRMPERDGPATLAELRRVPGMRDVPVIMISGDETDRGRALAAGAIDFLTKPYGGEPLLAAVERGLNASPANSSGR
ncbi:MAG: response regulator [Planctomycetaceae bacterium]